MAGIAGLTIEMCGELDDMRTHTRSPGNPIRDWCRTSERPRGPFADSHHLRFIHGYIFLPSSPIGFDAGRWGSSDVRHRRHAGAATSFTHCGVKAPRHSTQPNGPLPWPRECDLNAVELFF